jgi:hypothetical protein
MLNAAKSFSGAILYASNELKNNKKFVIEYVELNQEEEYILPLLSETLRDDIEIIKIFMKNKIPIRRLILPKEIRNYIKCKVEIIGDKLKDDEEFMLQEKNNNNESIL